MDWLTPTRRAVRWSPMVVAFALAVGHAGGLRLADRPLRADVLIVALAMVVIGALCGLHDPGRDFVHAMPVSAARRLTHRLVVLVPALAIGAGARSQRWRRRCSGGPACARVAGSVAFGAAGVACLRCRRPAVWAHAPSTSPCR